MVMKSVKMNSTPLPVRGGGGARVLRSGLAANPVAPAAPARQYGVPGVGLTSPPFFVVSSGAVPEEDVIDLGAPRRLRTAPPTPLGTASNRRLRRPYTPNPRLYPGPTTAVKSARPKRKEERSGVENARRRKRVFRRPVPNSRLYRPAPRPPPSPPAAPPAAPRPRATWPPPGSPRALDTASRAALRLAERRPPPSPAQAHARGGGGGGGGGSPGRRLVVRVPAAGDAPRPRAMDAANRHSTSPDCSDGNDAASAPSEFLAEFLSAIMRRQYAEALKYCRLILQYEPHNATARGFYPLLQHKLQKQKPNKDEPSSSDEPSLFPDHHATKDDPPTEVMEQEADESESECSGSSGRSGQSGRSRSRSEEASCASQSSLELDSSDAAVRSSPSVSLSRRTDPTDPTDRTDRTDRTEPTDSTSGGSGASGGCWESGASRSEPDDNGNATAPALRPCPAAPDDLENDNTAGGSGGGGDTCQLAESAGASLRRLRAQFACSIK